MLRHGIVGLVGAQSDMTLVAEASNGQEAIQYFRVHKPDITLMDLQMPEMGGLDATIAILAEFPNAHIIVLTTYSGDVQILRALKAGARAYLLKSALHKELLETIRAVHCGKKALSPEVTFQLAEHAIDDGKISCAIRPRRATRTVRGHAVVEHDRQEARALRLRAKRPASGNLQARLSAARQQVADQGCRGPADQRAPAGDGRSGAAGRIHSRAVLRRAVAHL